MDRDTRGDGKPATPGLRSRFPRVPAVVVGKPHLGALLNRREPLTIVRGPRGYGKTTLVSRWARGLPGSVDVLWLSCTAASDGRTRGLWELVADTMRRSGLLTGVPGPHGARDDVAGVLAVHGRDVTLVIDDFAEHLVPGIEHELVDLVQGFDCVATVVCTRERGAVETVVAATIDSVVIRPRDLLLTAEEIAGLVTELGLVVTLDGLEHLHAETGGWPALVRAVLANGPLLHDGERSLATVDLAAGAPFLYSVWSDLTDRELLRFVQRTALFEEFTVEEALRTTGLRDVTASIDRLVDTGLLVNTAGGLAYVPVVRRSCVDYFRARAPRQFRVASRRAAQVHEAAQRWEAALGLLVRAALWEDCARLVDASWVHLVTHAPEAVAAVVDQMPSEFLESHARLVIARDHLLPAMRELGQGAAPFAIGSRDEGAALVGEFALPGVLDAMEQSLAHMTEIGGMPLARGQVEQLQGDIRADLAPVLLEWAVARLLAADLNGALNAFRESVDLAGVHGHVAVQREAAVGAALCCALLGYLEPAEEWLRRADGPDHDVTDEVRDGASTVRGIIALERLELDGGQASPFPAADEGGDLWALATTVRAQVALGDGSHFQVLAEIEAALSRDRGPSAVRSLREALLVSSAVDLYLARGHVIRARSAIEEITQPYEIAGLARARIALLAGEFDRAAEVAREWLGGRLNGPRLRLDLLLVLAAAEQGRGRRYEAAVALEEAVAICLATGLVRSFLKIPRRVLQELAVDVPRVRTIVDTPRFRAAVDLFPPPLVSGQLSDRELQVLHSLAETTSLAAVAQSLYLSANTVKTHLRSIYRKLGTHSAIEAVERAREPGLLDGRPGHGPLR